MTKSLPDIGGPTIQDVGSLASMESGVHIMNLWFKFRDIYLWLLNEY